MMKASPTIVWFRQDLRLDDHPALQAAMKRGGGSGGGGSVIPVFIWAPEEEGSWPPGEASKVWLHGSLRSLDADLRKIGSRLIIQRGPTLATLRSLIKKTNADALLWSRRYEPSAIARDADIKKSLKDHGIEAESFNAGLLFEPFEIRTKEDKPYLVFTPFWKASLKRAERAEPGEPLPRPALGKLKAPEAWPPSLSVDDLQLMPTIEWAGGIQEAWTPGERGATIQLDRLIENVLGEYDESRNRPDQAGTSRLSPHLHFGELSPRRIWHAVHEHVGKLKSKTHAGPERFMAEIGWREFAHHLLFHFPHTPEEPLRPQFAAFPWEDNPGALLAWQRGRTGYPLVDAGLRELWHTGWMHNRVRMVVSSFLVKHLLLPWQEGAKWFWDTLVDADLANNTLGWQWIAGCGADAAPYFRIFNPVTQGEKFDPQGNYVRKWVPELARLPDSLIHRPWEAPMLALREAGVELGSEGDGSYPLPIVDHADARKRALAALEATKAR